MSVSFFFFGGVVAVVASSASLLLFLVENKELGIFLSMPLVINIP